MKLHEAVEKAKGWHLLAAFAEARAAANTGEESERHRRKAERLHREACRIVRESQ